MIAFQGENGAYSQEAIFETFGPETPTRACTSFNEIFQAVETGVAELGMLPIENSTAGAITQSYDLLLDHDLKIAREVIFRVRHALLANNGTTLADIRRVHSHPQALAQCERFIAEHHWEAVVAYDTAGAAKQLARTPHKEAAVIASETAARLYGLEVLARNVQDLSHNLTRFFVIAPDEPPRAEKSKTSIVFATRHLPGALYNCLGEFASRGISLTKIESRPDRRVPWHYVFYLDFEGHWSDPPCRDALVNLLSKSSFLKVLGSYPAG
ncbi:MAG: prephenate dehydratase [candidate division KSB1 bacterium]|nr:prephenate dehydratase [candidate division KSB1 bacterium]MDZ7272825.1 prephenate dehydratase [candidate division KSB1 bacterium]MDZ7284152.1 prephenate dehydratase [candidate division KSB1 bacterium]MDZ7297450.1 prephenate dehydratase [candidate division KSB1 bacterium]MDZ7305586.1 prephenate dehydratase [candidate division KSB1 bacterium]